MLVTLLTLTKRSNFDIIQLERIIPDVAINHSPTYSKAVSRSNNFANIFEKPFDCSTIWHITYQRNFLTVIDDNDDDEREMFPNASFHVSEKSYNVYEHSSANAPLSDQNRRNERNSEPQSIEIATSSDQGLLYDQRELIANDIVYGEKIEYNNLQDNIDGGDVNVDVYDAYFLIVRGAN
ncbi:hypothetical protein GQX74_002170 [Glossina fuscipes]|nr:hypothetical protein GQX74_002170 [Glossina fuscipes]